MIILKSNNLKTKKEIDKKKNRKKGAHEGIEKKKSQMMVGVSRKDRKKKNCNLNFQCGHIQLKNINWWMKIKEAYELN